MKKLIIGLCIAVCTLFITGCPGDYWDSNRGALLDRNHTFTKATVMYGNSNVVYDVVSWMDYDQSDTIQMWVKDDNSPRGHKCILTHYSRVVMENPDPKYDPKY